ncbi:MAG: hypothetical protein GKR87_00370 [Kiritimatiellae bacterium]|nr:hypothetical protein [Kiritimatiellia bacterium]
MAEEKARLVDGFTTLKAAQRAVQHDRSSGKTSAEPSVSNKKNVPSVASHIGHTVMPTKHDVVCYECTYQFQFAGRVDQIHCPKCKVELDMKDYTIDGPWCESIRTGGNIHIQPSGILKDGALNATDIILEGKVEGGTLFASRWLEIGASVSIDEEFFKGRDLRVARGGHVIFKQKACYRNVELYGNLKANLKASGLVHIQAGGLFEGSLSAEHLAVGGGWPYSNA